MRVDPAKRCPQGDVAHVAPATTLKSTQRASIGPTLLIWSSGVQARWIHQHLLDYSGDRTWTIPGTSAPWLVHATLSPTSKSVSPMISGLISVLSLNNSLRSLSLKWLQFCRGKQWSRLTDVLTCYMGHGIGETPRSGVRIPA